MAPSSREPWNLNRVLVLAGALSVLGALVVFSAGDLAKVLSPDGAPMLVGVVAALVLAFWQRPWLYLVAGILVAAFPLVVTFVFGAVNAIIHPSSGAEGIAVTMLVLGATLALVGGIAGFVQGRKAAQPPVRAAAPQAVAAIVAVAFAAGMVLTTGFAAGDVRALAVAPASNVVPDETVRVSLTGYAFEPKEIRIAQDTLVALELENGDTTAHTFTYHAGGVERNAVIPAKSTVTVLMKFDEPQSIHFWCAPHSMGAGDTSEEGMWGTLVVE